MKGFEQLPDVDEVEGFLRFYLGVAEAQGGQQGLDVVGQGVADD